MRSFLAGDGNTSAGRARLASSLANLLPNMLESAARGVTRVMELEPAHSLIAALEVGQPPADGLLQLVDAADRQLRALEIQRELGR